MQQVVDLAIDYARQWTGTGFSTTRLCCERFLRIFDSADISGISRAFLQQRWEYQMSLPLPKGKKGDPLPLGWQAMTHCYRWGLEAGVDKCSKVTLVFITRKAGKTSFAASLALATLKYSRNSMPYIYSLATKRDQATLTFRDGASMIKQNARKEGSKNLWEGYKALNDVILYERNDGRWETLPSEEDTLDGLQYELAILDEAAQVPDEIYNVVRSAMSDTVHGQHILGISTAGKSASNWFSRMVYEAIDCLEAGEDVEVNVLAWCVPEERPNIKPEDREYDPETDVNNPEVWKKTHPAFGVTITQDDIQKHFDEAKLFPAALSEFRRTRLNEFTQKDVNSLCTTVIQRAVCNKRHNDVVEEALRAGPCNIGIDISTRNDPTAVAISAEHGGKVYFKTRNWLCQDSYNRKTSRQRTKILTSFREQEFLFVAGGDMIDYTYIQSYVEKLRDTYPVDAVYTDRATAGMTFRNYITGDLGMPVLDFGENLKERSEAKQYFLDRLYALELLGSDNPMFRWELDNAAIKEMPDSKRDIVKLADEIDTPLTIDGVYALCHSIFPHAMAAREVQKDHDLPDTVEEFADVADSYFAK